LNRTRDTRVRRNQAARNGHPRPQQIRHQRQRPELASFKREAYDHPLPQILFYLIVATIPFFRWRQLPGAEFIKLDWLLTAVLLMILGPYLIMQKGPPQRLRANIWVPWFLFLLANLVAYILSPYPDQALSGLTGLLQATIFMVIAALIINEKGFESALPWTLGLSMGVGATMSALGYFAGVEIFSHVEGARAYGGSISANNMSLMCVFTFPIMVHWAVYGRSAGMKALGLMLAVLMVFGVVSTVSRGGFLSIMAIMGLLAFQYRRSFQIKYLGLVVAIGALALAMVIALIPEDFFARQATLITQDVQDRSLDRRSSYVIVAMDAIRERPIIGWGTDVFKKIWVNSVETRWYDMVERPAHNTYLEVAVGGGLIGLVIFILLLLRAFFNFQQAEKMLRNFDTRAAQLVAAYKLSLLSVVIYFLVKSGLEHKYFLLILPLSSSALIYARTKLNTHLQTEQTEATSLSSSLKITNGSSYNPPHYSYNKM